ncbi:hypothetical protein Tco_1349391 [Tanacetum coccineum]
MFEGVCPIENTPFKRIHASTAIARDRQSHRVKLASREGCSASNSQGPSPVYDDLGDCDQQWKIHMAPEPDPPEYIKLLLQNKHFMKNIRAYNQMFTMTSFGAKIDDSINRGRGLYVFKASGQIANRMRHFRGVNDSSLDPEIVQGLIHFLNAHNELVQIFRTDRDKFIEIDIPEFKIRLYNAKGARGYELLASNTLGAIVFYSRLAGSTDFDDIIQEKDGPAQRVSKLHPSYMALQFPLLVTPRQGRNARRNKIGIITTHWCQQ